MDGVYFPDNFRAWRPTIGSIAKVSLSFHENPAPPFPEGDNAMHPESGRVPKRHNIAHRNRFGRAENELVSSPNEILHAVGFGRQLQRYAGSKFFSNEAIQSFLK